MNCLTFKATNWPLLPSAELSAVGSAPIMYSVMIMIKNGRIAKKSNQFNTDLRKLSLPGHTTSRIKKSAEKNMTEPASPQKNT